MFFAVLLYYVSTLSLQEMASVANIDVEITSIKVNHDEPPPLNEKEIHLKNPETNGEQNDSRVTDPDGAQSVSLITLYLTKCALYTRTRAFQLIIKTLIVSVARFKYIRRL